MKNTIQDSVLAALKNGSQLTSAQISSTVSYTHLRAHET